MNNEDKWLTTGLLEVLGGPLPGEAVIVESGRPCRAQGYAGWGQDPLGTRPRVTWPTLNGAVRG